LFNSIDNTIFFILNYITSNKKLYSDNQNKKYNHELSYNLGFLCWLRYFVWCCSRVLVSREWHTRVVWN